jgi:lipopolysaccharide transport system permease protein
MNESKNSEHWDIVVDAKKQKTALNFAELWRYRDLTLQFAKRDIATVYNQTILGPLWFLIQPLLTTLLFLVVFGGIAKISTGPIPGTLFYLSGLTIWNYFSTSFTATANTFVANSAIFGKVYFPRLVTPLSKVISGLFIFGAQLILFLCFLTYFAVFHVQGFTIHFSPYLLLIPYLLLLMGGLGLGLGIIISSLTTKYRDLSYLVAFGIQLLMYLTPVIYPLPATGSKRMLILANPMSSIVDSFRYAFFPEGPFNWHPLAFSSVFMIVALLGGILLFNKIEKNFMDSV